jgi:carboxyl-terminal processing protease
LILSVAKYYSTSGKAIQETAVTPNVLVADETDNAISEDEETAPNTTEPEAKPKNTQDDQLRKAVEVLKSRTS